MHGELKVANVLKWLSCSDLRLRIIPLERLLAVHQGSLTTACREETAPASADSERASLRIPLHLTLPASESVSQDMEQAGHLPCGKRP